MVLLCKQKALYVKACIIQNGIADFHNDVLDATDIKKIFTSFNNQDSFEIYHNEIPIQEVSLLENYISKTDELIAGTNVPAGSWNAVIRVDNPQIKEKLLNNDFGGVSLNNRIQTRCSAGLTGEITYSDLKDAECVIPVYISFVDAPANNVGLHIMDYDVYIQKSKSKTNGGNEMSLIEDLKALIQKAEEEETPAEETTEEPVEETEEVQKEATEEEVVEEAVEETAEEVEEPPKEEEEEDDEPVIEKAEEVEVGTEEVMEEDAPAEFDAEAEILAIKEEIASLKAIIEEILPKNPIDEEVTSEESEPIITKSAKIEVTEEAVSDVKNFYEMTGRDPITGKKIHKESRILN